MSCFGAMTFFILRLITSSKYVHGKHPDLFRKFNKHLIVMLGMYKNTCIGVWSFWAFRPGFSSWQNYGFHC